MIQLNKTDAYALKWKWMVRRPWMFQVMYDQNQMLFQFIDITHIHLVDLLLNFF